MTTHVKVLAVLCLVAGGLGLLGVLAVMFSFGIAGFAIGASDNEDAGLALGILGLTGIALVTILIVTAVASLICGYGLLKRRRWARIFGIVLAAIELINFPIGTALGVYALWVLFNKETEAMFASST
jgi:hypothetical protein